MTDNEKHVPVITKVEPDGTKKEVSLTVVRAHDYWAQIARKDVAFFVEYMTGYKLAPFHKEWYRNLTIKDRLLIVCFMGAGKTQTVLHFTGWFMGHYPWLTNVIASVGRAQAEARMRGLKELVENPRYKTVFPWVEIDERKPWSVSAMNIWDRRMTYAEFQSKRSRMGTNLNHSCMTTSVGSNNLIGARISGLGIVDDPHSEEDARSPVQRENVATWYFNTFLSRFVPYIPETRSPKAIIISTRWAEDDLAGRIKEAPENRYAVLETPAEYLDENNQRVASWPEQWSLDMLDKKRSEIGHRLYRASYLNEPTAFNSEIFLEEWLKYPLPRELPKMDQIVISVDPAFKTGNRNDYTAIAVVGMAEIEKRKYYYLLELVRRKMVPLDLADELERIFDRTLIHYDKCDYVLIEDAAAQSILTALAERETNLPIKGVNFKGDKVQKARNLEAICNRGIFFADWSSYTVDVLKKEMLEFPSGKHDDTVDAVAQAINFFISRSRTVELKVDYLPATYFL